MKKVILIKDINGQLVELGKTRVIETTDYPAWAAYSDIRIAARSDNPKGLILRLMRDDECYVRFGLFVPITQDDGFSKAHARAYNKNRIGNYRLGCHFFDKKTFNKIMRAAGAKEVK